MSTIDPRMAPAPSLPVAAGAKSPRTGGAADPWLAAWQREMEQQQARGWFQPALAPAGRPTPAAVPPQPASAGRDGALAARPDRHALAAPASPADGPDPGIPATGSRSGPPGPDRRPAWPPAAAPERRGWPEQGGAWALNPLPTAGPAAAPQRLAACTPAEAGATPARATVPPLLQQALRLPEPPRVHLDQQGKKIRLWLGLSAGTAWDPQALVQTVRQVLQSQGLQLHTLVCNGITVFGGSTG